MWKTVIIIALCIPWPLASARVRQRLVQAVRDRLQGGR